VRAQNKRVLVEQGTNPSGDPDPLEIFKGSYRKPSGRKGGVPLPGGQWYFAWLFRRPHGNV